MRSLYSLTALALLLAAAPLAVPPLGAQTIEDARSVALAEDGTPYAATYGTVYRYDAADGSWTELVGTFSGLFFDIATGPGDHVWAGTGGVFFSLDGGQTWDWDPIHVSQHGGQPASILSVAEGPDHTAYAGGWRSTNHGQTWQHMGLGLKATAFVDATVYAGTYHGVYRSTNSGASWTPSGLAGMEVDAISASAAGFAAATADGLWYSADGAAWTAASSLAGVYSLASTPDGAFWAAGGLLGGLEGLYRSDDGTSWPSSPTAFAGQEVTDVEARGATLLAAVDGVPYRSTDAGTTWVALDGSAASVAVAAQPVGGPVTIGAGGGSFDFTVTLTNVTNQPQTFQAWTAAEGPVGREPVMGPMSVTLSAWATLTRTLTQQVPGFAPAGTYTYTVNVGAFGGAVTASDAFAFEKEGATVRGTEADWSVSGWDDATMASASSLPEGFALSAVHPNPSRGDARLTLEVAEAQAVRAEVYDALGRRVAVLLDGEAEAGAHALVLDGSALPAGVYVVRVTGETFTATRRATLVR